MDVAIQTIAGVKPGDNLLLDSPPTSMPPAGSTHDVEVTYADDPDDPPFFTNYDVVTRCGVRREDTNGKNGEVTNKLTLEVTDPCPSTDLLVTSNDGPDLKRWAYAPNVDLTGTELDVSSLSLTNEPTSKEYSFTNVPTAN